MSHDHILSVSEFNLLIKEVVSNLGAFHIRGEITEMSISQNNGVHITLSDGKANLRVGGFAPSIKGIDLAEIGMEVLVQGRADIYVPYGSFSLSAHAIEPAGEGALAQAYQKLKDRLEAEGLFAPEHKQSLPPYITHIALLTGRDSAAYSDFIKILKEHQSSISIDYYPVLVQGEKAVEEIIYSLQRAQRTPVDVIVLTRGGGSLEDLKAFNDAELAQVIFSSPKPIIAGVGHEKDESICDFVADIRASTPSQAAYYIVCQNQTFLDSLVDQIEVISQKLEHVRGQIESTLDQQIFVIENTLTQNIEQTVQSLSSYKRILESYNIKTVLKRGFALIEKRGKVITSIKDLKVEDSVETVLSDGKFEAKVGNIYSSE